MKKTRTQVSQFILVATIVSAAILWLAGCGQLPNSSSTNSTPASGTFTHVYQNTLSKSTCMRCHQPGGQSYPDGVPLDFTTQALAYQTLIAATVSSPTEQADCPGVKIIKASNASQSYLAAVLFSDYSTNNFGGVSGCQPYTAHHLNLSISSDEKTSIINWLNGGALNN